MYITTFYSFKGGVGRTMALVNVAVELARRGRWVLAVDFGLETPSVDTFDLANANGSTLGIIGFVCDYLGAGPAPDATKIIGTDRIVDQLQAKAEAAGSATAFDSTPWFRNCSAKQNGGTSKCSPAWPDLFRLRRCSPRGGLEVGVTIGRAAVRRDGALLDHQPLARADPEGYRLGQR